MRGRRSGSALVFVLLVIAIVVTLLVALVNAAMINVNLSRQFLIGTRARLLAQAAVQHFIVAFDEACAKERQNGIDLERREPLDLGLRSLYQSREGLPDRAFDEMRGQVTIDFEASAQWHSTDNSLSEYPAASWLDRGTAARSVPPFSVELLISVDLDGAVRHYQALVSRHWPYAVFAARGAIVICGTPSGEGVVAPSHIEGTVATLATHPSHGLVPVTPHLGNMVVSPSGPRYLAPTTALDLLGPTVPPPLTEMPLSERIRATLGFEPRCDALVDATITVGPRLRYSIADGEASEGASPSTDESASNFDVTTIQLPRRGVPQAPPALSEATEAGNEVTGDAFLPGELRGEAGLLALADNTFAGEVRYDRFPQGLDVRHNPADDARFPATTLDYRLLPKPVPPAEILNELGMSGQEGEADGDNSVADFGFLFDTLSLDPDQANAPPWQFGGHNRFIFHGNLGNRFVKSVTGPTPTGPTVPGPSGRSEITALRIFETSGGLRLRNTVLYVDGNLDLSARRGGRHEVAIEGSNSTLVVNGTLALCGGRLDARDQGMVILARDVVLRARGEYRGLIIAKNSLTILPVDSDGREESMLSVRGGIMCGNQSGDTVLRSVRVTYDPIYMKAVHGYGSAVCTRWRELR